MPAPLGDRAGVRLDPGPGVVDRQRGAGVRRAVAHDDRRLAVLDGVRERLLGDPEERQLDVGRRPRAVRALEADLAAGEPLDPEHEPVERRPDAEIVEDRQPQVAADRPEPVGDRPGELRALLVAGRLEAPDEQRQLLEGVVMDVGGEAGPLRFRGRDDEVALELGAAGDACQRPDGEPRPRPTNAISQIEERQSSPALWSVASANIGVAPATANSADSRTSAARRRRRPQRVEVERPGGGEPGQQRDRGDERPAHDVGRPRRRLLDDRERDDDREDLAERDREADRAGVPDAPGIRSQRPSASGSIATVASRPAATTAVGSHVAASGRVRNGIATATGIGAASGWSDVPRRPSRTSFQPANSSAAPNSERHDRFSPARVVPERRGSGRCPAGRPPGRSAAIAFMYWIGASASVVSWAICPASVPEPARPARRRSAPGATLGSSVGAVGIDVGRQPVELRPVQVTHDHPDLDADRWLRG